MRYAGKTAVVIGGTHGMGLAIASGLLAGGAEVLLTGRDEGRLAAARETLGPAVHGVRSDVTSRTDLEALPGIVEAALGRVDALFVNQGYAKGELFGDVTEASWDRQFGVNAKGAFFTVQALAPLLRDGGSVVFTSSVADAGAAPGMLVYSASKAALWSMTQGFAVELLPRGIRVNAVGPGFVDTPSMGVDATEAWKAEFSALGDATTPMRRHGTVEEVAAAAYFLAFDATFTTAFRLAVDGGIGQGIG